MKVKCLKGAAINGLLTEDTTYLVLKEFTDSYRIVGDDGVKRDYYKFRFEILKTKLDPRMG